jgi:hypothetical protein
MASYITAVKEALAKKQAAEHPNAKPSKNSKSIKKTAPPVPAGKPVKKVTGRGG